MSAVRKHFHSFMKTAAFNIHDKIDDISTGLAAETIIQLLFRVHGKGSCLFPVERTEPPVFPAGLFQTHIAGNDLHNIRTGPQLVQPVSRKAGCH